MGDRERHQQALDLFAQHVRGVGDDQWDAPTPCSEWNVRDLVNHNASENWWTQPLMEGQRVEDVGDRYEGDVLGEDPVAGYDASAVAARKAFEADDALERTVHLSFGDVPAAMYLGQRVTDLLVHGWDLAVATGQDPTPPGELASWAWEVNEPHRELIEAAEVFADPVEVPDDADPWTRLLGLLGRDRRAWEQDAPDDPA